MTTQEQLTVQRALGEIARAEGLAQRFGTVFENPETGVEIFTPDVRLDLNLPEGRVRLQGPHALESLRRGGRARVEILRTVPTTSGFVTEHEIHEDVDGEHVSSRRLWLCEIRDGRIAEVVGYSGAASVRLGDHS